MSVTYDLIIKYLCANKENNKSIFTTPKNNYAFNLPNFTLLNNMFCRMGVTVHDGHNNISFITSLLTLINNEFMNQFNDSEIEQVNKFKIELLDKYPSKYHVDKNDIREFFKTLPTTQMLQYIVDILNINFIIYDFKTETTTAMYHGKIMNPYKIILLLAKYDDLWEPIMLKDNNNMIKDFSYNDIHIINILKQPLYYHNTTTTIVFNNNINVIKQNEKEMKNTKNEKEIKNTKNDKDTRNNKDTRNDKDTKNDKDSNQSTVAKSVFIKSNEIELKEISTSKMQRMTKDKLIEHAQSLGIKNDMKKLLKNDIINLILQGV